MSRIADVVRKSRRKSVEHDPQSPDPDRGLRSLDEVNVPWAVEESAERPASPPSASAPEHPPAKKQRPVAVPRPVVPVADDSPASLLQRQADGGAVDELVERLFLSNDAATAAVRRVLFATPSDPSGAADMAALVAEALAAEVNGTVCLAEFGLHQPALHRRYALDDKAGLAEALDEPGPLRGCAHRAPSISNLWLLPARLPASSARPSLGDPETQRRVADMLATFDYIVASGAPIETEPDSPFNGELFDGVVLVVDGERTKSDQLRAAAGVIEAAGVRLIGTIVHRAQSESDRT